MSKSSLLGDVQSQFVLSGQYDVLLVGYVLQEKKSYLQPWASLPESDLCNQNFWAEVRKFLSAELISTSPNSFIPFHQQKWVSQSFKMEDVGSLLHVRIRARWWFRRWYQWCFVSCFMRSNLTNITGYLEQNVARYLPYEFKHNFRMTKRTFQIFSGNKSLLRAINSQSIHSVGLWSSHRPFVTAHGCKSNKDRSAVNNPMLYMGRGIETENGSKWSSGTVHFDRTVPTEKSGPPRKVDWFFRIKGVSF